MFLLFFICLSCVCSLVFGNRILAGGFSTNVRICILHSVFVFGLCFVFVYDDVIHRFKRVQEPPKRPPNPPKSAPGGPKSAPRAQEALRPPQDRSPQEAPRAAQDPKRLPRPPQQAAKCLKTGRQMLQDGRKRRPKLGEDTAGHRRRHRQDSKAV